MHKSYNQAAKILLGILTLIGIGAVILVAMPLVSSDTALSAASFQLSGHIIEPLVFALLFAISSFLALKLNRGWAALCGLPFLALAVLPFLQPNTDLSDIESLKAKLSSHAERIEGLVAAQSADHAAFTTRDAELSTTISSFTIKDLLVLDCGGRAGCSCPSGWSRVGDLGFTRSRGNLNIGNGGNNYLYLCER